MGLITLALKVRGANQHITASAAESLFGTVFPNLASEVGRVTVTCHMFHRSVLIEILCGLVLLTWVKEGDLFLALHSVIFDRGSKS